MDNTGTTTVAQLPYPIQEFYTRDLLENAKQYLHHDRFGQKKSVPRNNSDTIKFERYDLLPHATTPLTEGVTRKGRRLSSQFVTATLRQYGDYVEDTDWLAMTTQSPVARATNELVSQQAGETLDILTREKLVVGTNVFYANGVLSRGAVATKPATADYRKIVRTLKNASAMRIMPMVRPNPGQNTTPVNATFVSIISPSTTMDLKGLAEFVPVEEYASNPGANLLPNEVGKIDEIRFVETNHAKVYEGAGDGGADVHVDLIMGKNAYGTIDLDGAGLTTITKPLGSAGTADPLNQRSTHGWKATHTAIILNQSWMIRYEHLVTA